MRETDKAIAAVIGVVLLFGLLFFCYDLGQLSAIDSCEKLGFFYHKHQTFECRPMEEIPHEVPK
jgi:hypothetical protein